MIPEPQPRFSIEPLRAMSASPHNLASAPAVTELDAERTTVMEG
jgi:hypothetical protein